MFKKKKKIDSAVCRAKLKHNALHNAASEKFNFELEYLYNIEMLWMINQNDTFVYCLSIPFLYGQYS